MACWQCGADIDAAELFCPTCDTLQPPDPETDHFTRLGLERRFEQDAEAITKAHRRLQRTLHPDRFVSRGDRVRMLSLQHATSLNDALRILRDPLLRAGYLLDLAGRDVKAEAGNIKLDPAFLMEVFELREAIGELAGTDAHVERARLARDIAARYEARLAALGERLDAEGERTSAELDGLARQAAQLRYLRNILDDLQALG